MDCSYPYHRGARCIGQHCQRGLSAHRRGWRHARGHINWCQPRRFFQRGRGGYRSYGPWCRTHRRANSGRVARRTGAYHRYPSCLHLHRAGYFARRRLAGTGQPVGHYTHRQRLQSRNGAARHIGLELCRPNSEYHDHVYRLVLRGQVFWVFGGRTMAALFPLVFHCCGCLWRHSEYRRGL